MGTLGDCQGGWWTLKLAGIGNWAAKDTVAFHTEASGHQHHHHGPHSCHHRSSTGAKASWPWPLWLPPSKGKVLGTSVWCAWLRPQIQVQATRAGPQVSGLLGAGSQESLTSSMTLCSSVVGFSNTSKGLQALEGGGGGLPSVRLLVLILRGIRTTAVHRSRKMARTQGRSRHMSQCSASESKVNTGPITTVLLGCRPLSLRDSWGAGCRPGVNKEWVWGTKLWISAWPAAEKDCGIQPCFCTCSEGIIISSCFNGSSFDFTYSLLILMKYTDTVKTKSSKFIISGENNQKPPSFLVPFLQPHRSPPEVTTAIRYVAFQTLSCIFIHSLFCKILFYTKIVHIAI